jgi:L-threonylcarbamoyladenylate synthase
MSVAERIVLDECSEKDIDELCQRIVNGAVVIFPTDTVYGIGCSAKQALSVARVFSIKRRSPDKPLPVFTSDLETVLHWIDPAERTAAMLLASRFWPGPLTIVVDVAASGLHTQPLPYPEASSVGFRAPGHAGLLRLLQRGLLMAQTSLNESGHEAVERLDGPEAGVLIGQADIVLESRQHPEGRSSTVVQLGRSSWSMMREGSISGAQVHAALRGVLHEP